MAQVEQEAECVIRNTVGAVFPGLPGTVGNLTATRRSGHTQAQRLAAVAEFFGGHKVFQVRSAGRNVTPDATPPSLQKVGKCPRLAGWWWLLIALVNLLNYCRAGRVKQVFNRLPLAMLIHFQASETVKITICWLPEINTFNRYQQLAVAVCHDFADCTSQTVFDGWLVRPCSRTVVC